MSKKLYIILVIIVIFVIGNLIAAFYLLKDPDKAPEEVAEREETPVSVSPETQEYFKEYLNSLASFLEISDPFSSEREFRKIVDDLEKQELPVIFDGKVFDGIELTTEEETHYLKPKESLEKMYLEIISEEQIDPYDLLETGDVIRNKILRVAFDNQRNREFAEEKILDYLESEKAKGNISGYQYQRETDIIRINYPDQEIPWEIKPFFDAANAQFIVESYLMPFTFSENVLKEFEQLILEGNILVVNTKKQTYEFFPKELLIRELSILVNKNLSSEEKLIRIIGPVRLPGKDISSGLDFDSKSRESNLKTFLSNFWNRLNAVSLVQASGRDSMAVVPRNKRIYFFESTDKPSDPFGNYLLSQLRNPEGVFKPFYLNEYELEVVLGGVDVGDSIIPEFYEMMSSEEKDILFISGHGGIGTFRTEHYYIKLPDADIDVAKSITIRELKERRDLLWSRYGQESINVFLIDWRIRDDLLKTDSLSWLQRLTGNFDRKLKLGGFRITNDFFRNNDFPKKSIVFLLLCHGGIVEGIDSKIVLAPIPGSATTVRLFVDSDLAKIAPYLIKNLEVKDIEINKENMRSYDLLDSFIQGQLELTRCITRPKRVEMSHVCQSKKDTLCSIKLYNKSGQRVTISPHVKSVDSRNIEFNTQMDNEIPADQLVTITFDSACTVPANIDQLKPEWVSENKIKLNWLDKAYTEWTDNYQGPFALITINNEQAVSKKAKIKLTGNQDCGCTLEGCFIEECLREPTRLEYNANNPRSDFTFVMPCIQNYYEACEENVSPRYIRVLEGEKEMPQYIRVRNNCYFRSTINKEAIEITNSQEDLKCEEECLQGLFCFFATDCCYFTTDCCIGEIYNETFLFDEKDWKKANEIGFFLLGPDLKPAPSCSFSFSHYNPERFFSVVVSTKRRIPWKNSVKKSYLEARCEASNVCRCLPGAEEEECGSNFYPCRDKCSEEMSSCVRKGAEENNCWEYSSREAIDDCMENYKVPCHEKEIFCLVNCYNQQKKCCKDYIDSLGITNIAEIIR